MDLLADKMDELLELGVLAKPEDVGVTPLFTSPSMLVPKPDPGGGWRFVTDFTQLNNYIRKTPAISPGIEETKLQIASFKFLTCIDLSQFYFQNRMDRGSIQYLGVIHPYMGTLVYTVSPMGLRNSSEIAYERLTRIFGDMQKKKQLCRQADALIVGGESIQSLFYNLSEVFIRLQECGMTIKPNKLVICPKSTVLFGWEFCNQSWRPSAHKVNPLITAARPTTTKQLRSWLGASKQLSPGIKDYAIVFSPLEKLTAGKQSAEKILWTEEATSHFEAAKKCLTNMEEIYYPTPDDQIYTYSDFFQDSSAVGGRLEFVRYQDDGSYKTFHGGFFSARLTNNQSRWLPCEAECLGVKLVLEHFSSIIRQSQNTIIHYCDNLPTVLAYQRLKQGKFSASSRIAAFLTTVNLYDVKLVHKAGKDLLLTDYISRNPTTCQHKRCQTCDYVNDQVDIGEAIVNKITVTEILDGKYSMPYLQPKTWSIIQQKDPALSKLTRLIQTGQKPECKKTGGDNTTIKLLHGHFVKGNLNISSARLLTIKSKDDAGIVRNLIIIPTKLFPGLLSALHIKLQHPSKYQMGKLIGRYFYSPGSAARIAECVDACHTCLSLKPLPNTLFSETTSQPDSFGVKFSLDIMKRNCQIILFVVELFSQFCWIKIINSEKADDIENAIAETALPFMHYDGATFRCDGAPSFQALKRRIDERLSPLADMNVKLELGQSYHTNKNPNAEYAIKEGHLAINKAGNPTTLSPTKVANIARNINFKIRQSGLSSWELLCRRSTVDGDILTTADAELANAKLAAKLHKHNPPQVREDPVNPGDLVMISSSKTKLKPRETFLVNDVVQNNGSEWAETFKLTDKITSKPQLIKTEDLTLLPRQKRHAAVRAEEAIKNLVNCVQALKNVPTHAWNYDDYVNWDSDDLDYEESDNYDDNPISENEDDNLDTNHTYTEDLSFPTEAEALPDEIPVIMQTPGQKKEGISRSSLYPADPTHVRLDAVQNLSSVFQNLYDTNSVQSRSSARLDAKPRKRYSQYKYCRRQEEEGEVERGRERKGSRYRIT